MLDEDFDLADEEFVEELGINQAEKMEPLAILVGVHGQGEQNRALAQEHLDELEALTLTFGTPVGSKFSCRVRNFDPANFLPKGKLEELRVQAKESGANLLIFDDEISPAQQRNLEKFFKIAVMDRTELILEIFAARAQTREAKLQIELAQTCYEFPRLKRLWSHFSRQRQSGGGFLKGEGEKQLEIDKRLLKKKVQKLHRELKEVKKIRVQQRAKRERQAIATFAIVGYTNAGKSTLLNALTNAQVFTEDKLFATLDPTTRKFTLPSNQEVLLTDTVGFIRKLPHTLVAAFRSTLEAALHDDVLLHLVDLSHPMAVEHAEVTRALLKELNANESSIITVLNKSDLCEDRGKINQLRVLYPKTVVISAKEQEGLEELAQMMVQELALGRQEIKVRIPQTDYQLVSQIHQEGKVLYEEYEDNDVVIRAEIPNTLTHLFKEFLI